MRKHVWTKWKLSKILNDGEIFYSTVVYKLFSDKSIIICDKISFIFNVLNVAINFIFCLIGTIIFCNDFRHVKWCIFIYITRATFYSQTSLQSITSRFTLQLINMSPMFSSSLQHNFNPSNQRYQYNKLIKCYFYTIELYSVINRIVINICICR